MDRDAAAGRRRHRPRADAGLLPGIQSLAPTTWITSLATGDDTARKQGLDDLAAGTWELGPYRWENTALLSHFLAGEWFSVHAFQDAATGAPLRWYVNFELPHTRRPGIGIDTMDLALDLVITPDLTGHHWKDRDEYQQLRRLGVVDDYLDRQVEQARGRAIAMLDDRTGPFACGWPTWTPGADWPLPALPEDAATAAPAQGRPYGR